MTIESARVALFLLRTLVPTGDLLLSIATGDEASINAGGIP